MEFWSAHKAKLISDWDLKFMVSSVSTEKFSAKQQEHKDRIEKQLAATGAILEGILDDFETSFFQDHSAKDVEKLSAKQRPIMDRIRLKLLAWKGAKAGQISDWELG